LTTEDCLSEPVVQPVVADTANFEFARDLHPLALVRTRGPRDESVLGNEPTIFRSEGTGTVEREDQPLDTGRDMTTATVAVVRHECTSGWVGGGTGSAR